MQDHASTAAKHRRMISPAVRDLVFPGDKRRLMDMRRSGAVEAIAGGAGPLDLAAKLANSIGRSNTLHKTDAPVDIEAARDTDAARLRGRQRMRAVNKSGEKVSKQQPTQVSNSKPSRCTLPAFAHPYPVSFLYSPPVSVFRSLRGVDADPSPRDCEVSTSSRRRWWGGRTVDGTSGQAERRPFGRAFKDRPPQSFAFATPSDQPTTGSA
jgi:hypothetical protein